MLYISFGQKDKSTVRILLRDIGALSLQLQCDDMQILQEICWIPLNALSYNVIFSLENNYILCNNLLRPTQKNAGS